MTEHTDDGIGAPRRREGTTATAGTATNRPPAGPPKGNQAPLPTPLSGTGASRAGDLANGEGSP